jgi:hypothetical protein
MLDESLLDSPEALARADTRGLLRGIAGAGARARTASRQAAESGLAQLRPEGRPRAVLVAGPTSATSCAAGLLGALCNGAMPVSLIRPTGSDASPEALRWALPGWAGPLDLILVTTPDGGEAGLTALVEQAYRRGCAVVAVCPPGAPLAGLTTETHGLAVPLAPVPGEATVPPEHAPREQGVRPDRAEEGGPGGEGAAAPAAPGTLWSLLTPLLVLCDKLGLFPAGRTALQSLADRLDVVAERCGPAIATYGNPAKTLATELSGTLPLLWSEGAVAGAVARHFATTLTSLAGVPALAEELPEAMTTQGALLRGAFAAGGGAPEDFFRDRVEEPESPHPRVVLLRERAPLADSAVASARELAYAREAPLSELEAAEGSGPLEAAAELIATADFAAAYLALASSEAPPL